MSLPLSRMIRRRVLVATLLTAVVCAATAIPASAITNTSATPKPSPSASAPGHHHHSKPGAKRHDGLRKYRAAAIKIALADTARITGQTPAQVMAELRSGKSLDQIAGAKQAELKAAFLKDLKTALDNAVAAHKLTAAQEAALLQKAGPVLDKLMAHSFKPDKHARAPGSGSHKHASPSGSAVPKPSPAL